MQEHTSAVLKAKNELIYNKSLYLVLIKLLKLSFYPSKLLNDIYN